MGELYDATAALDAQFHTSLYARKPVMFVRGAGMKLFDDDGKEYLDFVSGLGAVNLGHAHPAVASAIAVQAAKLVHVTNLFQVEHRAELAQELVAFAGGGMKAFFCNSGAEATEGAIKVARRWGTTHGGAEKHRIITAERSFHGRTFGALAATGQPAKQELFAPLTPGFIHVPLNDLAALEAAIDDTVAAVFLEPVQGEAGVYPCDPDYLTAVRDLCTQRGVLLGLDEVQTGFYRTGHPFAYHGYGVTPDIVWTAKALGNGMPIGAVLARTEVADVMQPGDHGSTFAGGPVVCAASRETLKQLAAMDAGGQAQRVGAYLQDGLARVAVETGGAIAEIRGRGLMVAAELRDPIAADIAASALQSGIVVNNIGVQVLRFLPPLVCTEADVDAMLAVLEGLLAQATQKGDA